MVFGARPFGSRSFGDTAPSGAGVMPAVGEPGVPQDIELPTLGDLAVINAPTVTFSYTLTLPTLGSLSTLTPPTITFPNDLNLPTIGGGPVIGGLSITREEPAGALTPGTTIIWVDGGVTYTGVVVDANNVTVTKEDGIPVANYNYPVTDPWFWGTVVIDTTEPIPAIPASDVVPDPRVRVKVCARTDPTTIYGELDEAKSKQWQEIVNDAGTGSVVLQNDDDDLSLTNFGRLLRFELDEQAVFLAVIENRNIVAISQSEEVEEATEVGGRGALALWDDAVIYPEGGARGRPFSDQRIFNWTSADYYDGGWQTVMLGPKIGEAHTWDPGVAVGFPDGEARVIWAKNASHGGAGIGNAPVGLAYFRKTLNVPTAGWYRLFLSADDGAEVIIDGVQIYAESRLWFHLETQFVDVYLTAGAHQLAVKGENLDNETGDPATNSAWILLSIVKVLETGELGDVILRTDHIGWKAVGYPPKPPGMNVGRVMQVLLSEAQARGALLGWSLAFDDVADSAGQPWADEPELAFQCGLDCYSALLQIAESYVELDVAPAKLVLYAYSGGYGETTSATFTQGSNILSLTHQGMI